MLWYGKVLFIIFCGVCVVDLWWFLVFLSFCDAFLVNHGREWIALYACILLSVLSQCAL